MLSKKHYRSLLFHFRPSFSKTYQNKYEEHFTKAAKQDSLEDFWREQSKLIDWYKEPSQILDRSNPPFYRWFNGGIMNTSYNLLDRHVKNGKASQTALIYESNMTNTSKKYTFGEFLDLVSRFANVLQKFGVQKGDRVIIYMPMIPEAIIAQQACARIGAVHAVVFGGFGGPELAARIKDTGAKLIVSASCGLEPNKVVNYQPMIEQAVQIAGVPDIKRIIMQRDVQKIDLIKGAEFDFYDELSKATTIEPVPLDATDYLYILYTSGTTGKPKGVVRDNGGNAVALSYAMKHIVGVGNGEVYFSAADIGWAVGHSFVTYAPMLVGAASVLYEGKPVGTPDAGAFWKICEKHKVKSFFTSPTAIRSLRREDTEGEHIRKYDLSNLKSVFVAGERMDIPAFHWLTENLPESCLVVDNYWQSETGWQISSNFGNLHAFPEKPGSAGHPVPGNNVVILDEHGQPLPQTEIGAVCLKEPTAPSFASTIFNSDEAFIEKYFSQYSGHYFTGDSGFIDEEGNLNIVARLDDVINTAGHRLSTSQIEEVLTSHEEVVEAAVVGAKDELKGEIPVGFVVLKHGIHKNLSQIEQECIQKVRHDIGPVASFKFCLAVERLPKTRSGKIVRKVLRNIINGEAPQIPPTIEDASVVDVIINKIKERKLGSYSQSK